MLSGQGFLPLVEPAQCKPQALGPWPQAMLDIAQYLAVNSLLKSRAIAGLTIEIVNTDPELNTGGLG